MKLVVWTIENGHTYCWLPQYPKNDAKNSGQYDNVVSRGLRHNDDPFERVKEVADSHPNLNSNDTHDLIRFCGTISYHHRSRLGPNTPASSPRIQYVYKVQLAPDKELFALEGMGFEGLRRYSFEEAWGFLATGQFEMHAQMTMLAQFIRHGFLHPGNEPNIHLIEPRLHRRLEMHTM